MQLSDAELRKEWKEIAKVRITQDGLVCPDPCFLFSVAISAAGNQNATVKLYDGHSNVDDFFITLKVPGNTTKDLRYNPPMYFRKGLYIDECTDTDSTIIHYLPVKE